jgi:hypothetical protein
VILLGRWDAIHHLLRIGLVTPADLLDGEVTATEYLSRNHIVRVDLDGNRSFTIKQPRDAASPDSMTMWTEAAIFWLSANDPDFGALSRWMPAYYHYHEPAKILTIEYIKAAEALIDRLMAGAVEPGRLHELGTAFATLHGPVSRALAAKPERRLFGDQMPWALTVGAPGSRYAPPSPAAASLLAGLLHRPDALAALARIRAGWRTDQIIHGDAKAPNILLLHDGSIRIIDWEICAMGDGLWDLAGIAHSLILPNPAALAEPLPAALARAGPWLEAFLAGYGEGGPSLPADGGDLLLRMTGARILQTCLECAHQAQQVSGAVAPMFAMALELLAAPEASRHGRRWAA